MESLHRKFERILVTGAGGFIGSRLVAFLNSKTDADINPLLRSTCDLSDSNAVFKLLEDYSPDCIFHIAAVGVSHARANDATVINENLKLIQNLAHGCTAETTMIVAGSMAEYGGQGKFRESDVCKPETEYGKAKLAVTNFANELAKTGAMRICVARLFGVYGPGELSYRLFPSLINGLMDDQTVELSDGKQSRDFIHVDDVCDCLLRLASSESEKLPAILNLGSGRALCLRDVCTWICDGLGKSREKLGFGLRHRSPGDADLIEADVRQLQAILGFLPPQRLEEGMDVREIFELTDSQDTGS